jgi:hypothetical protein
MPEKTAIGGSRGLVSYRKTLAPLNDVFEKPPEGLSMKNRLLLSIRWSWRRTSSTEMWLASEPCSVRSQSKATEQVPPTVKPVKVGGPQGMKEPQSGKVHSCVLGSADA